MLEICESKILKSKYKEPLMRVNIYMVYMFLAFLPIMIPFYNIEPDFIKKSGELEFKYLIRKCKKEEICKGEFDSIDYNSPFFSFKSSFYMYLTDNNHFISNFDCRLMNNNRTQEFYVFYSLGVIVSSLFKDKIKTSPKFYNKPQIIISRIILLISYSIYCTITYCFIYFGLNLNSFIFLIFSFNSGFFFKLFSSMLLAQYIVKEKSSLLLVNENIHRITKNLNINYCFCGIIHISAFYLMKNWIINFLIFLIFSCFNIVVFFIIEFMDTDDDVSVIKNQRRFFFDCDKEEDKTYYSPLINYESQILARDPIAKFFENKNLPNSNGNYKPGIKKVCSQLSVIPENEDFTVEFEKQPYSSKNKPKMSIKKLSIFSSKINKVIIPIPQRDLNSKNRQTFSKSKFEKIIILFSSENYLFIFNIVTFTLSTINYHSLNFYLDRLSFEESGINFNSLLTNGFLIYITELISFITYENVIKGYKKSYYFVTIIISALSLTFLQVCIMNIYFQLLGVFLVVQKYSSMLLQILVIKNLEKNKTNILYKYEKHFMIFTYLGSFLSYFVIFYIQYSYLFMASLYYIAFLIYLKISL